MNFERDAKGTQIYRKGEFEFVAYKKMEVHKWARACLWTFLLFFRSFSKIKGNKIEEAKRMEYTLTQEMVKEYERYLWLAERSNGTIQKYLHNIEQFRRYLPREKTVTKEMVIAYKKSIAEKYDISTANAALVALNGLFSFLGWCDCRVKPFKQQRCIFRDKERELSEKEYLSLLKAAKQKGNQRLFYIMETLCNTGIRISELQFITAEAVWTGTAVVKCKGKQRKVLLPQRRGRNCRGIAKGTKLLRGRCLSRKRESRSAVQTSGAK